MHTTQSLAEYSGNEEQEFYDWFHSGWEEQQRIDEKEFEKQRSKPWLAD